MLLRIRLTPQVEQDRSVFRRPLVKVQVAVTGGRWRDIDFLVDTGSDFSTIPIDRAKFYGIETPTPASAKSTQIHTASGTVTGYRGVLRLRLGTRQHQWTCYFTESPKREPGTTTDQLSPDGDVPETMLQGPIGQRKRPTSQTRLPPKPPRDLPHWEQQQIPDIGPAWDQQEVLRIQQLPRPVLGRGNVLKDYALYIDEKHLLLFNAKILAKFFFYPLLWLVEMAKKPWLVLRNFLQRED